jgi:ketosteroid isomerase-like protein
MVSGKDQIRQFFTQLMSKPGFAVSFAPTKIEVSKSRDVAYEIGTAELKLNDAQGQPTTIPAKYVVVWSKDSNRHWKAVADVFNTNK